MPNTVSEASLHRLPRYLKVLRILAVGQRRYVTSAELAQQLRLDETLVRKDIASTGFTGKPRVGFAVLDLVRHIEGFLDLTDTKRAFLIGAGRLGQALASYRGFETFGLSVVALFDNDPEKIGHDVGDKRVEPLWRAPALARLMNVRIAVLTVPPDVAQAVADLLADAGIIAFWNFSGAQIKLASPIIVHNEDLAESLAVFSHRISRLTPQG